MLFNTILAGWLTVISADATTTHIGLHRGARETLLSQNPYVNHLILAGEGVGVFYGLKQLHKTKPKTSILLGIAFTTYRGWVTSRNWNVMNEQARINRRNRGE